MAGFFTTGLFTQTGKQGGIDELREELHQDVAHLESEIADNSTAITANTTAIAENASAIAQNASAISENATAISALDNDLHANYYTKTEVDSKISSVYKYMGSVERYADLPTNLTEEEAGYVYNVETADAEHHVNANDNLAWNGTAWDNLGGFVDFSTLATKAELAAGITAAEQFATSADAAILQEAKAFTTSSVADEAQARTAADATKVDKELTSATGTSSIFNEVDGGGTMFTRNDGIISYVGVHDGTDGSGNKVYKVVDKATGNPIAADGNMLMGQIYVRDANHAGQDGSISVIDLTKDGFYYKHGANTTVTADNEIATKGDIAAEITALRNEINTLKAELVYKGEILGE